MSKNAFTAEENKDFVTRISVILAGILMVVISIYLAGPSIAQSMTDADQRVQSSVFHVTGKVEGVYTKYTSQSLDDRLPLAISYTVRVMGKNYDITDKMAHELAAGHAVGKTVSVSGDWKGLESLEMSWKAE